MIDYSLILVTNYVDKLWTLTGDSYEGLDWRDESPKPTQEELDALWESTQATVTAKEQSAKDAKASALAKLSALGLTEDEIKALVG
jgi:alkylhydroperoxidase family enzyme